MTSTCNESWCPNCDVCGDNRCPHCGYGITSNHNHDWWMRRETERLAVELAAIKASGDTPW